ncbi:MAG TPA: hypothetical protein VGL66_14655 [Caulobacteraceae bacterium]|jgi:hypothetical protein
MPARLKVFTWSDGFRAHTVAVSSRAKALKAWGVTHDLFKDGFAREIDTGADYDRALAEPGVVIDRGEAIDKGKLRALHPPPKPRKAEAKPEKPKGPDPADVRRVETLKNEMTALEKRHAAAIADLDAKAEALETKRRDLNSGFSRDRADLKRKLADAERKLR